jgi:hypothetical protein
MNNLAVLLVIRLISINFLFRLWLELPKTVTAKQADNNNETSKYGIA